MGKKLYILIILILNVCTNQTESTKGFTYEQRSIKAEKVASFLAAKQPIILDVRSESEYNTDHLDNAINIPFVDDSFELKRKIIENLENFRLIISPMYSNHSLVAFNQDKNKTYFVHCAAGVVNGRSFNATRLMDSLGFEKVYNLEGGFTAWKKYKMAD